MDFMYLVNQDESTEITPRACGKNSPCTGCKGCKGCRGGCRAVQEIFLLANLQMHGKGGDNSPLFIKTSMR